jgi:hypothetical protein
VPPATSKLLGNSVTGQIEKQHEVVTVT